MGLVPHYSIGVRYGEASLSTEHIVDGNVYSGQMKWRRTPIFEVAGAPGASASWVDRPHAET